MNSLDVVFVGISADMWRSVPAERPLEELGRDLRGMERRIAKGVSLRVERSRHLQLSELLEELALAILHAGQAAGQLVLSRGESLVYFDILHAFAQNPNKSEESWRRNVHAPQREVRDKLLLLKAIPQSPLISAPLLDASRALLERLSSFFEEAKEAGSGVIEGVTFPALAALRPSGCASDESRHGVGYGSA